MLCKLRDGRCSWSNINYISRAVLHKIISKVVYSLGLPIAKIFFSVHFISKCEKIVKAGSFFELACASHVSDSALRVDGKLSCMLVVL